MRLDQEQKQAISDYINRMELTHLDLRDEVSDHMMSAIENKITSGISFDVAFGEEVQKWKKDLSSYSSFWLGLLWSGPRIVIEKCVKQTKTIYLKSALVGIFSFGFFYVFNRWLSLELLESINMMIGVIYLLIFASLLFLKFQMRRTGYQTSFSFLFNINAISFSFLFILYNPVFTDIFGLVIKGSVNYVSIFMHAFTLAFSFFFFRFYTAHMLIQKTRLT
jgi:hypothetical protein